MPINKIYRCLCCESELLEEAITFKPCPLTDQYLDTENESIKLKKYNLYSCICKNCGHLQLADQVSVDESYENYIYNSSITSGISNDFLEYADSFKEFFDDPSKIKLLDVGSNDGSFLGACLSRKIKAFGIEPAKKIAEFANLIKRPTINGYFTKELINKISLITNIEQWDIISFNNVLANLPNPVQQLKLAKSLLKNKESIITVQTGYHPVQFAKGLFDYIYHEHFSYFSKHSLIKLASRADLYPIKIINSPLRGGTLRVYLSPDEKKSIISSSGNIFNERFTSREELLGLDKLKKISKKFIMNRIIELREKGYKIAGYGASHSTGILVHEFELFSQIDFLFDENNLKFGRYMPGTRLIVEDAKSIYLKKNIAVIILAWQYFDKIREKLLENGFKGPIIKPVLP